jgi:hypothetical protein
LLLVAGCLLLLACEGEDRPQVDVIGGGGNVSVSASASGSGELTLPSSPGGATRYQPVSNVDTYFQISLDMRDIRAIMSPAAQGQPVDWNAARTVYENGKNQLNTATGALRSMASLPNESRQAMFPNGVAVYGRPNFIDAIVRDGLNGAGRAQGVSDDARRQIVDKGMQMIAYAVAVQELEAGKTRLAAGNTDNATGAPHVVDEAWATVAGAADDNGALSYSLLQTAVSREANFNLQGRLREPMETAFIAALAAAQRGDIAAYDAATADARGYLNAIFYLGALRYVKQLEGAPSTAQRETQLAEGWAFWQTIRALVAQASPGAAQTIESAYTRNPAEAFPPSQTAAVYAALNEPAVLANLGIPAALVVRTPPP